MASVNDEKELLVKAVTENISDDRAHHGHSYNFNTAAPVDVVGNNSNAMAFIKNTNPTYDLIITQFIHNIGVNAGGLTDGTEFGNIIIVRDPTSISSSTDRPPVNKDFGSSNTLTGTFQVGAAGATLTGGTNMIETLFDGQATRIVVNTGVVILEPGNSLGIVYIPPVTTTQQFVQFALAMYLDKNID